MGAMLDFLAIIKNANTKAHQIDDNIGLEKSTTRQISVKISGVNGAACLGV